METKIDYKMTRKIDLCKFRERSDCMLDVATVLRGLVEARQWQNTDDLGEEQKTVTAINSVSKLLSNLVSETYEPRKFKVVYEKPLKTEVVVEADDEDEAIAKAESARNKTDNPDFGDITDVEEAK